MDGQLHAVALLAVLPAVVAIGGWTRRSEAEPSRPWARVAGSLLFALAVVAIPVGLFYCTCGPGNNPRTQILLPAFGALIGGLWIRPVRVRRAVQLAMLGSSIGLAWHFHTLVVPGDKTRCAYTGDAAFISNSCSGPASVGTAWHTPLTGLMPLGKPLRELRVERGGSKR